MTFVAGEAELLVVGQSNKHTETVYFYGTVHTYCATDL